MDDDCDWGQFDDDVDAADWGHFELDGAPAADEGSCPVRDLASALGRRSPVSVADAEAHDDSRGGERRWHTVVPHAAPGGARVLVELHLLNPKLVTRAVGGAADDAARVAAALSGLRVVIDADSGVERAEFCLSLAVARATADVWLELEGFGALAKRAGALAPRPRAPGGGGVALPSSMIVGPSFLSRLKPGPVAIATGGEARSVGRGRIAARPGAGAAELRAASERSATRAISFRAISRPGLVT